MRKRLGILLIGLMVGGWWQGVQAQQAETPFAGPVESATRSARFNFGLEYLRNALSGVGIAPGQEGGPQIAVGLIGRPPLDQLQLPTLPPDSYLIQTSMARNQILVAGANEAGAMYGCFDLGNRIHYEGRVPAGLDLKEIPDFSLRMLGLYLMGPEEKPEGITPERFSWFYDQSSWKELLNLLAHLRINVLVLWHPHPFASLVEVPGFPEARQVTPEQLAQNQEMLRWILDQAQQRNVWVINMFYANYLPPEWVAAKQVETTVPGGWIAKHVDQTVSDYLYAAVKEFLGHFPGVGLMVGTRSGLPEAEQSTVQEVIRRAATDSGHNPPKVLSPEYIDRWFRDLGYFSPYGNVYPLLLHNQNVLASPEPDPANTIYAQAGKKYVVNLSYGADVGPWRWGSPRFMQECLRREKEAGADSIHFAPLQPYHWPAALDKAPAPLPQWRRDWMWYLGWSHYAWKVEWNEPEDQEFWLRALSERYGTNDAARSALAFYNDGGLILPALQSLLWLGTDAHSVPSAGATLAQLQQAPGIPFGTGAKATSIPAYLQSQLQGQPAGCLTPLERLGELVAQAEQTHQVLRAGKGFVAGSQGEYDHLLDDMTGIELVAKFYLHQARAAVLDGLYRVEEAKPELAQALDIYRQLTKLTADKYEAVAAVTPEVPFRLNQAPYHWQDLLPKFEAEYKEYVARRPQSATGAEVVWLWGVPGREQGPSGKLMEAVQHTAQAQGLEFKAVGAWLPAATDFLAHTKLLIVDGEYRTSLLAQQPEALPTWLRNGGRLAVVDLQVPEAEREEQFCGAGLKFSPSGNSQLRFAATPHVLLGPWQGQELKADSFLGSNAVVAYDRRWQVLADSPDGAHWLEASCGSGRVAVLQLGAAWFADDNRNQELARHLLGWKTEPGPDAPGLLGPVPSPEKTTLDKWRWPQAGTARVPALLKALHEAADATSARADSQLIANASAIRQDVVTRLGISPSGEPPSVATLSAGTQRDHVVTDPVVFRSSAVPVLYGDLYRRDDVAKGPAVIMLPGVEHPTGRQDGNVKACAMLLAASGMVTVVLDLPSIGRGRVPGNEVGSPSPLPSLEAGWLPLLLGDSASALLARTIDAALSSLAQQPYVDANRLGILAEGETARIAGWVALGDPRVQVLGGVNSLFPLAQESLVPGYLLSTLPGVLQDGSWPELLALLPPRQVRLYQSQPAKPDNTANEAWNRLRELAGSTAAGHIRYSTSAGSIGFLPAMNRAIGQEFGAVFGPITAGTPATNLLPSAPAAAATEAQTIQQWVTLQAAQIAPASPAPDLVKIREMLQPLLGSGPATADAKILRGTEYHATQNDIAGVTAGMPAVATGEYPSLRGVRDEAIPRGSAPYRENFPLESQEQVHWGRKAVDKLVFRNELGLSLPALLIHPATTNATFGVLLVMEGDPRAVLEQEWVKRITDNAAVLAFCPSTLIPAASPEHRAVARLGLLLGRGSFGYQLGDTIAMLRELLLRAGVAPARTALVGQGLQGGMAALYAAVWEPRVGAVAMVDALGSLREYLSGPTKLPAALCVPGLLREDIPQVAQQLYPVPLAILNPHAGNGEVLDMTRIDQYLSPVRDSYAPDRSRLVIHTWTQEEKLAEDLQGFLQYQFRPMPTPTAQP